MNEGLRLPSFTFWQRFIRLLLLIYLLWLIWDDLYIVVTGLQDFYQYGYVTSSQVFSSFLKLSMLFSFLAAVYLVYIFWFAQFILPVTRFSDRITAFTRLLRFGISPRRQHGTAIFVRDGEIIGDTEEIEKNLPGVVFVDLRSAITLDKNINEKGKTPPASVEKLQKTYYDPKSKSYVSGIRAAGPGLTFIDKNEKITGTVDLRKQSRSRKDIYADTRDGIRVKTSVSCAFTLGQPPDILDVCSDAEDIKKILVIEWDDSFHPGYKKIKHLSRDLHPDDEKEISLFIANHPNPYTVVSDVVNSQFPYTFDTKRVEDAIYSETWIQDSNNQTIKKWSDWPQDVVAEKFRILLAKWPYMNLYTSEDPNKFPLKDFKQELSRQVRNSGVLAYRVVTFGEGKIPQAGQIYRTTDLTFYPPRNLKRLDVLRYRGIKVLSTGVGELEPVGDNVRSHMRGYWLSTKQKEVDLKSADYNLEVDRVRNQARISTQQNIIYHLTQLLENEEYPREALAMLIYQELEAAAANPETRKLLPEDTLSLLTGIGTILLPQDKGPGQPRRSIPIPPNSESD